jgi:hypothetical protein
MWQVERHTPRSIDVGIVGEGPPNVKEVILDGYYMIKNDTDGRYVYDTAEMIPKTFNNFDEVVKLCAWFIERDYPGAVKHAA